MFAKNELEIIYRNETAKNVDVPPPQDFTIPNGDCEHVTPRTRKTYKIQVK